MLTQLTPKYRNNNPQSSVKPKMLVGLFPVCCGTEALPPTRSTTTVQRRTSLYVKQHIDLGSLISDNTHGIERITVYLKQSTPTIVPGPTALCAASKSHCQVTPSLMMWRLPVSACRAHRMHGILFLVQSRRLSPSSSPTSPVPYSRQRGRLERVY
jgi:hypothetical protein